jgi:hypothetical protein
MGFFTFRAKKRRTMRRKTKKGGMFGRLKNALGFKPKNVASSPIKDPRFAVIEQFIVERENTPKSVKNVFHLAVEFLKYDGVKNE